MVLRRFFDRVRAATATTAPAARRTKRVVCQEPPPVPRLPLPTPPPACTAEAVIGPPLGDAGWLSGKKRVADEMVTVLSERRSTTEAGGDSLSLTAPGTRPFFMPVLTVFTLDYRHFSSSLILPSGTRPLSALPWQPLVLSSQRINGAQHSTSFRFIRPILSVAQQH
jgi:hypothetical protein